MTPEGSNDAGSWIPALTKNSALNSGSTWLLQASGGMNQQMGLLS